jgi:hypothetical protein
MDEEELVTEERKKQDAQIKMGKANTRRLIRQAHDDAINKLPNELRDRLKNWNPYNPYEEDY